MPGSLLRITSHTGDKHFSSAAMSLDPVSTAGHLVSMVVADGIVNAPTALLANHMESSLAAALAKEGSVPLHQMIIITSLIVITSAKEVIFLPALV